MFATVSSIVNVRVFGVLAVSPIKVIRSFVVSPNVVFPFTCNLFLIVVVPVLTAVPKVNVKLLAGVVPPKAVPGIVTVSPTA